jgi:hypothetical protein
MPVPSTPVTRQRARVSVASGVTAPAGATARVSSVPLYSAMSTPTWAGVVGRPLLSIDVARAAARYGHPHVCLRRARLLALLADGLPAGTLVFGRAAVGVDQDARRLARLLRADARE